ncbi:MAG TPA: PDZ domain-containing protein, partial [Pirellulales bacterium]|nr:PDZ domain-containing protein [Pirellulales bacterium]
EIFPHGAAAAAKLEPGDIILKFDGIVVESIPHLQSMVGLTEVGRDVPVVISRAGQKMNMTVRIAPAASPQAAQPAGR